MADEPYDAKSHLRYLEDRVSVAQRALKKDPKNLALIKALQADSVSALAIKCVGQPRPHLKTHEERHSFRKAARLSFMRVAGSRATMLARLRAPGSESASWPKKSPSLRI